MLRYKSIGVFDSGIGGLSVLSQLMKRMPFERYIYLGDTARVPYGNKSAETVKLYSRQCAEFLKEKDVKLIIVACNTASALALDEVRAVVDVPVIGMIYPAAEAALAETENGKIGVIGTRATISSNAYAYAIYEKAKPSVLVYSRACPLFVPIVEEGWLEHPATKLIAEEYLQGFREENIDSLILGCTHYPLLKNLFKELLPDVKLIDSGENAALQAYNILKEQNALAVESEFIKNPTEAKFFVTDVPSSFYEVARRFLGISIESPKLASLEK